MNSGEQRRSNRYSDFLPIYVSVSRNDAGREEIGQFSARILDVSNHGACLLLTQVMLQSFHIFHSTREEENTDLFLHINVPSENEPIEIRAQPVWMNAAKIDDIKVFKMGVDFFERIDDSVLQSINKLISGI